MAENSSLRGSSSTPTGTDPREQHNARALRAQRRDLQLQVEAFISSFSHDHGDTDEQQVHRTYDHLTRQLTELTQSVSHELQSEESNDLSERLQNLGSILTGTYHQWCNEISNTHLESHNKSPDIQPHDSASNVGSGLSKASSRTPPQLARQQIDLELERQKLELQYQLRKAELTAKEKRLALSNPGSLISRHCPVPVRASASFTDFGNRDVRTTALKRNLQTTFASNLEQHASMEATSRNSGSAAKENPSVACGIGLPLCDSAEQSFPIADHVGGSSHSNCAPPETTQPAPPHPQQNLHYLTDSLPQLPAFKLPDEAQQTFRGQHQPLQRHNLHHDTPRTRDYVENHVHSGATHANKALETSTILEIPMAQIHEQNRKTPSQDHFAQPQNYNNAAQLTFHRDRTNHTHISPAPQTSPHLQYAQASSTQQLPRQPHFSPGGGDSLASSHSYQLLLEEAREIRFTGRKLPFIFYFNQITELLHRCSDPNRKMDLLRASCQEQAREAISALVPRVPGWAIDTQVDRALEGLRLRYGCCSFLSEPLVKKIRSGPKFNKMDVNALEQLLSELNDCELYARAYKQTSSLNSSFILDIAERLPFYFKTRYTDYLVDHCGNPDDPSFDTFKFFLNRELKRINTTFAQRLLGSAPERSIKTNASQKVKVHQTSAEVKQTTHTPPLVSQNTLVTSNTHSGNQRQPPVCFICSTKDTEYRHLLNACNTYKRMTLSKRYETITAAGHCTNCLLKHNLNDCTQDCKCRQCGKHYPHRHTTSLHELYVYPQETRGARGAANSLSLPPDTASNNVTTSSANIKQIHTSNTTVLTRISALTVINPQTQDRIQVYAQHDPGSEVTLVSTSLAEELGLHGTARSRIILHTVSGSKASDLQRVSFEIETLHTGREIKVQNALVLDAWADENVTLPHDYDLTTYPHFDEVDIQVLPERTKVDILIGLDNSHLMTALEERTGAEGEPHAIHTPLGWIASGGKSPFQVSYHSMRLSVHPDVNDTDQKILELQQTIRDLSIQDEAIQLSVCDRKAQQIVEDNTRVVDGRYEMPVPFKDTIDTLPSNFQLATKRLSSLRQRMLKNPEHMQAVAETMSMLKQQGYIIPADPHFQGKKNYLPYFLTSQDKPRIVYDGSATVDGRCINDCILSGPDLLNSLTDVLAKFRLGQYALMADITKCFFQVLLPEKQQDYFRILWYKDDDVQQGQIESYKFTRHVWGVISSPYIACAAIRKTAADNPTNASSHTTETVKGCMYMDDMLFSRDTQDEAQLVAKEAVELLDSRGFELVKWTACKKAKAIIAEMDEDNLAPPIRTLDLKTEEPLPDLKAVGCVWNAEDDVLKIHFSLEKPTKYTRRILLSQLSSHYDPLGYCAPLFLKGRLILQQLAIEGKSWDEPISQHHVKSWNRWLNTLEEWKHLSLPRWYFEHASLIPTDSESEPEYELHAFSDASNEGYGCVVYIRRTLHQSVCISLVFGKSRVVLKHQQNWPIAKKELFAAVISVELMAKAIDALQLPKCQKFFWCDSKVVLQWLSNPELRLDKFTSRRIDRILLYSQPHEWHFCPTDDNPADVASRPLGKSISFRINLWLQSASFLNQPGNCLVTHATLHQVGISNAGKSSLTTLSDIIQAAPSWYALKKRAAYLMAFAQYMRQKHQKQSFQKPILDAKYLETALQRLTSYVQRECFGSVMEGLRENSPDSLEEIIKLLTGHATTDATRRNFSDLRSLRCLRPYVCTDGTLRIEGRLGKAALPTDEKFPMVLPSRHSFTRLLVLYCHEECAHGGIQYTLMLTRRQFWIIKGLSSIRYYTRRCNACIIRRAHPLRQLMADLPAFRMAFNKKPFANTGCDYFGPILYKEGRSEKKAWGLLFTCLTIRAIHVEIVTSLDLSSFILAFSRFIDLRGPVRSLYSDNGSTFKAAAHVLPELLQSQGLQSFFRQKELTWEFIPPYSPSQGGAWESLIKVFKQTLLKTVNLTHRRPTLVELQTYISNTTRLVNDRPLTSQSDDPRDYNTISPSSLLTPSLDPVVPIGQPHHKDHLRRDYRYNCALAQQFWERWVKFYLPQLQKRKKWFRTTANLQVGQMVLVGGLGELPKRGCYRMGRVARVLPQIRRGRALVRRAIITVSTFNKSTGMQQVSEIERDLSKIAPLEFCD